MSIENLNAASFDAAIGAGKALVDFWAGWCMPCKMVAPVVEEIASEYENRVTVAKVDVDAEEALAVRFGVDSIPTVILFSDGVEVKRFIGVRPKKAYTDALID